MLPESWSESLRFLSGESEPSHHLLGWGGLRYE